MTQGTYELAMADLSILNSMRANISRSLAELQAQGRDSRIMRQSLKVINETAAELHKTIAAARASL